MSKLNYGINDKPKKWYEWVVYIAQYFFCVLPATMLISKITGMDIAAGLISAGLGTIVFLIITKFRCAMITSNSGATVTAITATFALGSTVEQGFMGIVIGGFIMMLIYIFASILVKKFGTNWLDKLMPPIVSGSTIVVIGASLVLFIPTYAQVNDNFSYIGLIICLSVMLVAAAIGHYAKGVWKTLPFLFAIIFGYILCIVLTFTGVVDLVDFNAMKPDSILSVPDLAFMHLDFINFDWSTLPNILLMFGLVSLSAMSEHIADVKTAGQAASMDYTKNPGLDKTLLGDGVSSFVGSLTGAQMTTTYSEYTGTLAVSGVASTWVTFGTAITLIIFGFITPFVNFLYAMPNCVIAGVSILAYGAIAATGLRTLIDNRVDFSNNKNLFIFGAMFSIGISGLYIPINDKFSIKGIVFSMLIGIILNLILRRKNESIDNISGEIWRDIENFSRYQVSNTGRVKAKAYTRQDKSGRVLYYSEKILSNKPYIMKSGRADYCKVVLINDSGEKVRTAIHRLVATVFIPNPKNKTEVNHIDQDKSNNDVTNLEWVTKEENINKIFYTGSHKGQTNGNAKLRDDDVRNICKLIIQGKNDQSIIEELNLPVSVENIAYIRKKEHWFWMEEVKNLPDTKSVRPKHLTEEQVKIICNYLKDSHLTYNQIISMVDFPISRHTIGDIKRKRSYKYYKCVQEL